MNSTISIKKKGASVFLTETMYWNFNYFEGLFHINLVLNKGQLLQTHSLPFITFHYVEMLSLSPVVNIMQAQSHIVSKEIHSIDLDPSCPYQLAFHLDDGW